jgi:putative protease
MSQAVTGRSGNRGVCAQPCRSRYTLTDGEGNRILSDKFLLSLKDLNLMNDIPNLVAAGITTFKIEGRYKEIDYVKNVTAAYSRTLDAFILHHPDYRRSSSGRAKVHLCRIRQRHLTGDLPDTLSPDGREDCFHGYAEVYRRTD